MPQLPTEIIAQIVEHYVPDEGHNWVHHPTLWALCLVSRAWKDVAQPHLWAQAAVLFGRPVKRLEAVYTALAANPQLGRFIKLLIVNLYKLDTSKLLQTAAKLCPNLQKLELTDCSSSNQDFCELAKKCDKLTRLALVVCPNITAGGIIRAAPFFPQLRKLFLCKFPDFGDRAVRAIVDSCPLLQSVRLESTDLTYDGFLYVMLNAPALVDLSIQDNERIERRGFEDILCQRPVRLKELYVWFQYGRCYFNGWSR
ncbi:hypothetical protein DFS34DRAFT_145477 [Phlyctochytrium arcticum]|nr:hypothetical protein DFS34DRAFT_145477 [Phlyctochytrium arcticum]